MSKNEILEEFGANAGAYVDSEVHARGASLDRLVDLLQPEATWHVLDIATGTGHTAFALAPHVASVTATDITPQMLEKARQLAAERRIHNVLFDTADAGELPYADGTFDLVTCRIAAHHFADIPRFIGEAARVIRRGGRLAVVDNIVPSGGVGDYVNAFEQYRDPSHGRCWSLEEWTAGILDAGLVIVAQETIAKRLDFAFWAQRHGPQRQAYLRAMLSEAGPAAKAVLDPRLENDTLTFRLLEGIIVAVKIEET